jgi:glycolate oxidase FAD binding subunit
MRGAVNRQQQVQAAVTSLLGADRVQLDAKLADRLSGQSVPVVVAQPPDETGVSALLQRADDAGWTVVPIGGATQLDTGGVGEHVDLAISTAALDAVIEYSPADMVITVQSGMRFAALQELLTEHGQMLPIDPACAPEATVGGLVSTGTSGPHRVLYGTLRDLLIGTRIALPDGRVVRTGGKVVKNVAGYDLSKLVIGALGTLGIVTECTFKLKPLPLHRELCLLCGNSHQVQALRSRVMDTPLIPSAFEAVSAEPLQSAGWVTMMNERWIVAVDCDENHQSAAFQTGRLLEFAKDLGMDGLVLGEQEVDDFWALYREVWRSRSVVLRLQAPPAALSDILEVWSDLAGHATDSPVVACSLPAGVARIGVSASTAESLHVLHEARSVAREYGAATVLERAPLEIRRQFAIYDSPRLGPAQWRLQHAVQRVFDPNGTLHPSKIVGGI